MSQRITNEVQKLRRDVDVLRALVESHTETFNAMAESFEALRNEMRSDYARKRGPKHQQPSAMVLERGAFENESH